MDEPNRTRRRARRRTLAALALASLLGLLALSAASLGSPEKVSAAGFQDAMRKLWEDHVTWTRLAIVSIGADLPDTTATVNRLLQNQADIGNAIRPFYGDAAGDRLTALLTDHIVIAANILTAFKAGDAAGVDQNLTRWYANAEDIASFLHAANPKNWPFDSMHHMMQRHLDLTLEEAVAQLTGDYARSVAVYEDVHLEILAMADMLTAGIVAQFSHLFNGSVPA